VPASTPQYFTSYVATVALLETLVGFTVARAGPEVVRNIEETEKRRRRLGEYWTGAE
jgi:hypothetical protein